MGKKAQTAGQIFVYVLAIVVVGLIIAYGYSAIKDFTEKGEQVEYITLQKGLENSVKAIMSDYGSVKRPDVNVPGAYEMICFMDREKADGADGTALCTEVPEEEKLYQPIACSGWKTGRNNVFLIPDGSDAFDVGNIVIKDNRPFICLDVINNKVNLQLKGLGDKVEVSQYG